MLMWATSATRAELVGWWTFDDVDGDTVPDSSPFGNDGSLMAGATISDDVPDFLAGGQSLELAGVDDHVLVEPDESLDILEAITIAAWIKPIGNFEWDGIVAKNPSDGSALNHAGNYELRVENGTRSLTFLNQQGGFDDTMTYGGGPIIVDSEWQHVAVTVNEDGVSFFRNGAFHSSRPLGGAMFFGEPNTSPLYIGSRADLFTTMDGLIDDLRIYSEVISDEDIRNLAGADPPPPPPEDLLTATIHSVSSELVTNFSRGAENVVNGSGLFQNGGHSITPDGMMWLNAGNGCCGDEADPLGPEAEIIFDLGSEVSVDRMKVWNYNETLPGRPELLMRGAAVADILIAGEDLEFTMFASDVDLDIAPGIEDEDFGQVIDLNGISARYVKVALLSNHGGDNDFIGLSEVNFFGGAGGIVGDFNRDSVLDAVDIDLLTDAVIAGTGPDEMDLNGDGQLTDADRRVWVVDLKKTWFGDATMDGNFNTTDFVQVLQRGQYEDGINGNSGWADGDWNGDKDFGTGDLVTALQDGGYEVGPRTAVSMVPEPASSALLTIAMFMLIATTRRGAVVRSRI
jgi:hypothetical protein